MNNLLDNVTVRVTIEVTKKGNSWGEADTLAKSVIEQTSSMILEEIENSMEMVAKDALTRAAIQLTNTRRIKAMEQQNKLLAENPLR